MSIIPSGTDGGGAGITELPALLKRWMTLQEEIGALNSEVKQRRTHSKNLKLMILRIMETNNVVKLNVSKGAVVHKTRTVPDKLSSDSMLKHFKEFFSGDEERARALISYLEEHRGTTMKHDLKLQTVKPEDDRLSHRS